MYRLLLAAAFLVSTTGIAAAQLNQSANGIVRGIQSVNASAQVGEVAIYPGRREMIVAMHGSGNPNQAITLNRGFDCADQAGPMTAMLGTVRANGRARVASPLPPDRLLSGNYNVVVHNNGPRSRPVACGHLYR